MVAIGADIAYQWTMDGKLVNNGSNITGSETDTLVINSFTPELEGVYQCVVQNQSKTVTVKSNTATLRLNCKS